MKELQRLMTGCEAEWKANPRLLARATEIIESMAKQLEAKGDCTEEYNRGFKEGVQMAGEITEDQKQRMETEVLCGMGFVDEARRRILEDGKPIGKGEYLGDGKFEINLNDEFKPKG